MKSLILVLCLSLCVQYSFGGSGSPSQNITGTTISNNMTAAPNVTALRNITSPIAKKPTISKSAGVFLTTNASGAKPTTKKPRTLSDGELLDIFKGLGLHLWKKGLLTTSKRKRTTTTPRPTTAATTTTAPPATIASTATIAPAATTASKPTSAPPATNASKATIAAPPTTASTIQENPDDQSNGDNDHNHSDDQSNDDNDHNHSGSIFPNKTPDSSHFAVVFLVLIALLFGLYALYHNRGKIIAVVVEGRSGAGNRGARDRYRKLDNNSEDLEAGIKNSNEVYVY